MKKMTKATKRYPGDGYYRVTDCGGYYSILIASDKHNLMSTYKYDGACGTLAEVEAELKAHTFNEIRKLYREQCVYHECDEMLY